MFYTIKDNKYLAMKGTFSFKSVKRYTPWRHEAAPPIGGTSESRRKRKSGSGRWNMACAVRMTAGACVFSALIATCVMLQPASAKTDNLRVITDGNWEEILAGEWMIELWVIELCKTSLSLFMFIYACWLMLHINVHDLKYLDWDHYRCSYCGVLALGSG